MPTDPAEARPSRRESASTPLSSTRPFHALAGCGLGVNGTQHYLNGTPATSPRFPDMRGLVAKGHAKGLKMGWYFNGCGCIEKREPASGWDVNYQGGIAPFGLVSADPNVEPMWRVARDL